ncbi:MAG: TPM domain-containing protein [Parcubacteria group bacterium]|nr:TPM domain-containing protein [Parcubacteria group bacterium]
MKIRSFVSFVFVLIMVLMSSYSVFAETGNELVVDNAGIFGSGLGEVEAAAQKLVAVGADVRVRTVSTLGGAASIDYLVQEYQRNYASWRSPNGGRKSNLVVVMVSMREHKLIISAGGEYDASIAKQASRIRTDIMNPRLKSGDNVGAFVGGLTELANVVQAQAHSGGATTIINNGPGADFSGLWHVLRMMMFLVGGGAGVYFLFIFISGFMKGRDDRRAAQQAAKLAKQAASDRIVRMQDAMELPKIQVNALSTKIPRGDFNELTNTLTTAETTISRATTSYSDADHSAGNPDVPNLSSAEYREMENTYKAVTRDLQNSQELLDGATRKVAEWEKKIEEIPNQLSAARASVQGGFTKVNTIKDQGFPVEDFVNDMNTAETILRDADKALEEKRFADVLTCIASATQKASDAVTKVQAIVVRKKSLDDQVTALRQRGQTVHEKVDAGVTLLASLRTQYAATSLESVKGNGIEASKRVQMALSAFSSFDTTSMDMAKWSEAEAAVTAINRWLDEAESFIRSIGAIAQSLAEAKGNVASEIAAARKDIERANTYIHTYDDDIKDSLWNDLQKATAAVEDATRRLVGDRPDYLDIVRAVKAAHKTIDGILAEARKEHEAVERIRTKAVTALRDAKAAVSKAEEYIDDHKSDVGKTAKNNLATAKDKLGSAERTNDLQARIDLLEDAEDKEEMFPLPNKQQDPRGGGAFSTIQGRNHHYEYEHFWKIAFVFSWNSP